MVSPKSFIVAYGLTLLPALVSSSPVVPRYFQRNLFTRDNITSTTVTTELGPQLSNGSLIFGPDSSLYANATERWNLFDTPDAQVVVQPAAESDIAKIVKYCDDNSFEFLVRNRGHGTTNSLSAFSGIEIDVELLQGITIQPDNQTAIFQAGTYGQPLVKTLWDAGFVTPTGSAACVGLMGPALGGGHSFYEGLYGMVMDSMIHYNVVLANGTEIGVNATSHPDLLWALKGAGHNFAVVTSVVKKIFPRDYWHTHTYTWTQDKLETVFEALNTFAKSANGTTPPRMGSNYGSIIMNPNISTTEAVMEWGFNYAGPADEAEKLLAPFNAIGAVAEATADISYPDLFATTAGSCPSGRRAISSVMTLEYNVTAERALYENYVKNVAEYPTIAPTAYLYHEGYATAGYQAIPSKSTAYSQRQENHIMVHFSEVPEGSDLLKPALAWAKESWDIWDAGQPTRKPRTYINYAQGHHYETLESVYGYEPWRLNKLRSLKAIYDPQNRFRFFVPIIKD